MWYVCVCVHEQYEPSTRWMGQQNDHQPFGTQWFVSYLYVKIIWRATSVEQSREKERGSERENELMQNVQFKIGWFSIRERIWSTRRRDFNITFNVSWINNRSITIILDIHLLLLHTGTKWLFFLLNFSISLALFIFQCARQIYYNGRERVWNRTRSKRCVACSMCTLHIKCHVFNKKQHFRLKHNHIYGWIKDTIWI